MDKRYLNEILDYGLFNELDSDSIELPIDELRKKYKYFSKIKIESGKILLFLSQYSSMRPKVGDIGFYNNEKLPDGKYPLSFGGWIIEMKKGMVRNWLREENVKVKELEDSLTVETIFPYSIQIGNNVFINGKPADDGRYTRSWWRKLYIQDGKITNEF